MIEQKLILLVEDDEDIRRNMKSLLEDEGYRVELAENGQLALDYLNSSPKLPAMIILDLMMPVMDGFQFRQIQQGDARLGHIPVAIMTADGHIDEKRLRTRANAALRKPADIEDILDVVSRLTK